MTSSGSAATTLSGGLVYGGAMSIRTVTPILIVDAIEPLLPTYAAIGFTEAVRVPHGAHVGFVILVAGDRQLMLQTQASLVDDLPPIAARKPKHLLYLDVDDADVEAKKADRAPLVGPRDTPYGKREAWFEDAAGNVYGLASPKK